MSDTITPFPNALRFASTLLFSERAHHDYEGDHVNRLIARAAEIEGTADPIHLTDVKAATLLNVVGPLWSLMHPHRYVSSVRMKWITKERAFDYCATTENGKILLVRVSSKYREEATPKAMTFVVAFCVNDIVYEIAVLDEWNGTMMRYRPLAQGDPHYDCHPFEH